MIPKHETTDYSLLSPLGTSCREVVCKLEYDKVGYRGETHVGGLVERGCRFKDRWSFQSRGNAYGRLSTVGHKAEDSRQAAHLEDLETESGSFWATHQIMLNLVEWAGDLHATWVPPLSRKILDSLSPLQTISNFREVDSQILVRSLQSVKWLAFLTYSSCCRPCFLYKRRLRVKRSVQVTFHIRPMLQSKAFRKLRL
jgi:hypothetical protein